jgi:hypothetical protein
MFSFADNPFYDGAKNTPLQMEIGRFLPTP